MVAQVAKLPSNVAQRLHRLRRYYGVLTRHKYICRDNRFLEIAKYPDWHSSQLGWTEQFMRVRVHKPKGIMSTSAGIGRTSGQDGRRDLYGCRHPVVHSAPSPSLPAPTFIRPEPSPSHYTLALRPPFPLPSLLSHFTRFPKNRGWRPPEQ